MSVLQSLIGTRLVVATVGHIEATILFPQFAHLECRTGITGDTNSTFHDMQISQMQRI
ncbi:hypothetical protein THIOM_002721 [Candidatus Thiomargarita nelsonii]|uniref:Uncharacterized protein n=1 Tax=Candidatus Thiomargarita nelsonii TaxID=1003181 RepID=A0A176S0R6_9GAMM|nr:hypothetical protein THIOM_002721 [Candidatus Thiomargarita nelsonii]